MIYYALLPKLKHYSPHISEFCKKPGPVSQRHLDIKTNF